jgi:hypothetical protein
MVSQAIATTRAISADANILVRGDSAFGNRAVIGACRRGKAQFSLVMTKNAAIRAAIDSIGESAWTPVRYPNAVQDPDTGAWISDAEVAEVPYTAFASTTDRITARLVVRRVKDARYPDALFPVWRYHPFLTNSRLSTVQADIVHRRHAIIETVFADLIDGPLAHMPSGRFGRELRMGAVRGDRAQPAACRGHYRRRGLRRRARRDPAPTDHHRPGPTGPTCPHTGPAPA